MRLLKRWAWRTNCAISLTLLSALLAVPCAQAQADTADFYRGKTITIYVGTGMGAGAVSAGAPDEMRRSMRSYGLNLGLAFQLVDDALDYVADPAEMGKARGDDFREGKMTLPVILAYARGSAEERTFWQEAISGERSSDADLAPASCAARLPALLRDGPGPVPAARRPQHGPAQGAPQSRQRNS